eukprot:TRINITY_DN9626_c0_g3_i2.p1 TRINITY_DN9626_c0_g3~~TRINITY_DN9626_c0_g3_i2.p1  ORF type:complete len:128 (+),score=28.25 TRINITY_DN9626_c0_g3_i2:543-926(+)
MKLEVAKVRAAKEKDVESIKSLYASNTPGLQESIRSLAQDNDEFNSKCNRKITEEIDLLTEQISNDQKIASETEEMLLNSIKEVYTNTQRDIEVERKLREESERSLMRLFELANNKLSARIISPSKA